MVPFPFLRDYSSQGMWLATRYQLRRLSDKKSCDYLNFDENSVKGHVETHSGSIQMFRPNCGLQKVGYCAAVARTLATHGILHADFARGGSDMVLLYADKQPDRRLSFTWCTPALVQCADVCAV